MGAPSIPAVVFCTEYTQNNENEDDIPKPILISIRAAEKYDIGSIPISRPWVFS
jgi:hypothetical protein